MIPKGFRLVSKDHVFPEDVKGKKRKEPEEAEEAELSKEEKKRLKKNERQRLARKRTKEEKQTVLEETLEKVEAINWCEHPILGPMLERSKGKLTESSSVFSITINSNKAVTDMAKGGLKRWTGYVEWLWEGETPAILTFLDYVEGKEEEKTPLDKMYTEYKLEIGKKTAKLHLHAIVAFVHNGKYQMDLKRLHKESEERVKSKVHIFMKASSNLERNWGNYMRKTDRANGEPLIPLTSLS